MADIAFVPKGNILERCSHVSPDHSRQAAQAFPGNWIAFVRHRRAALLAWAEILFNFEHLGSLEMAKLCRPTINGARDQPKPPLPMNSA